jgi:solute:Na+ symporter, SSS family
MNLPLVDLVVLVLYLAGTVALGLWMGRRSGSTEEFMAAGRRIPGWAVGLSIFGTFVSSISFLANPGKAYADNWNPFVFSLTLPFAAWIAVRWFVPFYRRSGEVSAYHHLEQRFGAWARTYAVVCYLLTQITRTGMIMFLLALALGPLTGWNPVAIILLTSVLVIVYTLFGGIEAVIWTDVMQSIVLIGGALACTGVLLFGMPEGPGQLFAIASEHGKFSPGSLGVSLAEPTVWVVFIYALFINLQNFGIDQSYVQRYATAKTDADATRSVWLGALLYLPVSAVFFFIGTGLFAFYTARPELLPAGLKADEVFPHFIVAQLPVGVTGLVIAGVFAAAQSTISSSINCSATLVLCDLYRRYLRPQADERESMRVLWLATLVFGALGTVAAIQLLQIKQALDAWWELAGIFSGGMLGLFLLGMLSRRAGNAAGAVGVVAGLLTIVWATLSPRWGWFPAAWQNPFHGFLTTVLGTSAILVTGFCAGLLLPGSRPSKGGKAAPDHGGPRDT